MNREQKDREIYETRQRIIFRDDETCQFEKCYGSGHYLAHRIAQTVANKKMIKRMFLEMFNCGLDKKGIDQVLHHDYNIALVCERQEHNSSFNIANKPEKVKRLLSIIFLNIKYGIDAIRTCQIITKLVEG